MLPQHGRNGDLLLDVSVRDGAAQVRRSARQATLDLSCGSEVVRFQEARAEHDGDEPDALLVVCQTAKAEAVEQSAQVGRDCLDGEVQLCGDLGVGGRGRRTAIDHGPAQSNQNLALRRS